MPRRSALALAALLLCLATARADDAAPPGPLTAQEYASVRQLAEQALKVRDLLKGKVYLTRVEVYADGDRAGRLVTAIYYRYEGDLAILTHLDLAARKVIAVETIAHLPTSLAPEELAEAEKLARAHREVARALARYADGPKIEVDAQMAITAVPDDPTYRHRVVRLRYRRGHDYLLHVPCVDVDLSAGTVFVRAAGKGHE